MSRNDRKRARLLRELTQLKALPAQVDNVIERKVGVDESRQARFHRDANIFASVLKWVATSVELEPPESAGTQKRDAWLRSVAYQEPLLTGVLNSVVDIDKNRGWTIEGGRNQVRKFTEILHQADDGNGWREYIAWQSQSYLTTRMGFVTELGKEGKDGPLRALWSVDPTVCALTGKIEKPLKYSGMVEGAEEWDRGSFFRGASLVSTNERHLGLGFPAVERCLSLAKIMIGVLSHFKQQVLTEVPEGVLIGKNISQAQWDTALEHYGEVLQGYSERFARLMSLMNEGDAAPELAITWFRKLPEGFDLSEWVSILMYGYALAFGYDPREFWPVSSGQLGTAKETDVQHRKATSKGDLDFSLLHQEKLQREFPESLSFEYQSRDIEGEQAETAALNAKAQFVQSLAELQSDGKSVLTREQILELAIDQEIVPEDFAIFEQPTTETDTDEKLKKDLADQQLDANEPQTPKNALAQVAEKPAIQEAARRFPNEPIVRYYSPTRAHPSGRWQTLFHPGDLDRHIFPIVKIDRALRDFTSEYRVTLFNLAAQVATDKLDYKEMAKQHKTMIREISRGIYEEGLRLSGIDSAEMDQTDEDEINGWISNQLPYVTDFAKETREMDMVTIQQRVGVWVKALEVLGMKARSVGQENQMGTWKRGNTEESCSNCAELNGQRHRVKWFKQRGFLPREPASPTLKCGGWACKCGVYDDNGKRIL